ncbi:MAG: CRTAC1 family protein [Pseudomonadota bacterium]
MAAEGQGGDDVIAVAFRRSLTIIAVIGVIAIAAVIATRVKNPPDDEGDDAAVLPPKRVQASAPQRLPEVLFTDITATSGIGHEHENGAYGESLLPEAMGGGVAVFDYNDDGAVDLLFVSGQPWAWRDRPGIKSSLTLYRGNGSGSFEDVTTAMGLDIALYGMGVAVGDYDGDGDVDVFLTAVGGNRLFRNDGGERFVDATAEAAVAGDENAWSTGAAFFDYDRDGDLDLFVANYVVWSRDIDLAADYQLTGIGRAYGPPNQFAGTHSFFYRNDGDRFSDISMQAGIQIDNPSTGLPLGKSLAVLPEDVDGDGWLDLVVANDTVRNFLFINNRQGGFTEMGVVRGIAFDNSGAATGAMGIDSTLLEPDGELAVAIGNFGNEMTSLYVLPQGSKLFTDEAIITGVGPASRRVVTFGLFFFDYDLDGRPDILQANGHVEDDINIVEPAQRYAQSPQLFWNCGDACERRYLLADETGDLAQPLVGRGATYADIDGDGDLDVILTQIAGPPRLLRNDQASGHGWIQIDVRDVHGAPAYGALVEVILGGRRLKQRVQPTRSYLSQVEARLTFGLGSAAGVDEVVVTWPNGRQELWRGLAANTRHRLMPDSAEPEPEPAPEP